MSFSMKCRKTVYNLFFWLVSIYAIWLILFKLATDFTTIKIIWAGPIVGMAAILYAALKIHDVLFIKMENNELIDFEKNVLKGFFKLQKKEFLLTFLIFLVSCPLIYKFLGLAITVCFIMGVAAIYLSSFLSSLAAICGNLKTAGEIEKSDKAFHKSLLNVAISSFFIPVGFSLISMPILYFFFKDFAIVMGFTFGACLEAFLLTNSGAIFSFASKLINKEKDELKEPMIIANALNVKNQSLDFILTLVAILTGTIINGVVVLNLIGAFLPLTLAALGIFCTIVASSVAKAKFFNSKASLFVAFILSIILYLIISYYIIEIVFMPGYGLFYPVLTGVIAAIIFAICGYFNLRNKKDELAHFQREEKMARSLASIAIPLLTAGFLALAAFVNAGGMESYTAGFWGLGLSSISILSVCAILGVISTAYGISNNAFLTVKTEENQNKIKQASSPLKMYTAKAKFIFSICSIYASLLLIAALVTTINLDEVDALNPFVMYAFIFGAGVIVAPLGLILGSSVKAVKKIFKKENIDNMAIIKIISNKCFIGSILPTFLICALPLLSLVCITKLFEKILGMQTLMGVLFGIAIAGGILALEFAYKNSKNNLNFIINLAVKLAILSVLLLSIFLMPSV